jgi:hypothetical protein
MHERVQATVSHYSEIVNFLPFYKTLLVRNKWKAKFLIAVLLENQEIMSHPNTMIYGCGEGTCYAIRRGSKQNRA